MHFKASKLAVFAAVCLFGIEASRSAHATVQQWVFNYNGAEETFVAPATGTYDITAYGAQGGGSINYNPDGFDYYLDGGDGAAIGGDIILTKGEVLTILVGGSGGFGGSWSWAGGGGGGSFVALGMQALVVAGGGGGADGGLLGGVPGYPGGVDDYGYGLAGSGGSRSATLAMGEAVAFRAMAGFMASGARAFSTAAPVALAQAFWMLTAPSYPAVKAASAAAAAAANTSVVAAAVIPVATPILAVNRSLTPR